MIAPVWRINLTNVMLGSPGWILYTHSALGYRFMGFIRSEDSNSEVRSGMSWVRHLMEAAAVIQYHGPGTTVGHVIG